MKNSKETLNISSKNLDAITLLTQEFGSSNSRVEVHHTTIYFILGNPRILSRTRESRSGGQESLSLGISCTLMQEQRYDVATMHSLLVRICQSTLEKNTEMMKDCYDLADGFGVPIAVLDYLFQRLSIFLCPMEMTVGLSTTGYKISRDKALIAETSVYLLEDEWKHAGTPLHTLVEMMPDLFPEEDPPEICSLSLDQLQLAMDGCGMN